MAAGVGQNFASQFSSMVPIETPLMFSGFHENVLRDFGPLFQQLGIAVAQGRIHHGQHPSNHQAGHFGWEHSLNPGETIAGVLVDGDMSVTGAGTVSYNDGKRVLAFGHPFFNLGPMDMARDEGRSVDDHGIHLSAHQDDQCHRRGGCVASGPP